MATCDPATLIDDSKCFLCLQPQQMLAVMVQLLCEILNGGNLTSTCIVCLEDSEQPSEPATCDCSLAYNMSGDFWYWDSLKNLWMQFDFGEPV